MTRYIVTGAAGHLGRALLHSLLAQKQPVRGLILPTEKPDFPNVEYIVGDVLEPNQLRPLFQREDGEKLVVIHTAGIVDITGKLPQRMYDVNVTGTRNVLRLCKEYQVDKLVHVSSVHAIPERDSLQPQTEIDSFSPDLVIGGYAKTKAIATQAVLDEAAAGLPAAVVHPSGIIGPYDSGRNHLVQLIRDFMEGQLPACVPGGYDFVDVRDVAEGCIRVAQRGMSGVCYILSGSYHEIREILELAAPLCGRKCPPLIPMGLAKGAEPFLRCWSKLRGKRPPVHQLLSQYLTQQNSIFRTKSKAGAWIYGAGASNHRGGYGAMADAVRRQRCIHHLKRNDCF